MNSTEETSSFGPPTALLRWQKRRAKSEYHNPYQALQDQQKRLSSTLPFSSAPFQFDKDYSKDDSVVDKVSKDYNETVSVSKPLESKMPSYQFGDSSRIEEWQQKQEQKRMVGEI